MFISNPLRINLGLTFVDSLGISIVESESENESKSICNIVTL